MMLKPEKFENFVGNDVFVVVDQHRDGNGDSFHSVFTDEFEAKEQAERDWGYLVASEKKEREIVVYKTTIVEDADDFVICWDFVEEVFSAEKSEIITKIIGELGGNDKIVYDGESKTGDDVVSCVLEDAFQTILPTHLVSKKPHVSDVLDSEDVCQIIEKTNLKERAVFSNE